jgi:Xaa-Pro aminopeptidase
MKTPQARLIIAASEQDANLFWATGFLAPDPIIYLEHRNKKHLILNDLEVDRGRKEARVDRVLRYSDLAQRLGSGKAGSNGMIGVISQFLKEKKIRQVAVPYDFPLAYAEAFHKKRIRTVAQPDPFYPKRLIKTPAEKRAIRNTLRHTGNAIRRAYKVLRESRIKGDRILWRGKTLTSEILRGEIHLALLENNCLGKHTIVACGNQGVDPHCEGSGPLRPHQPIIMDVFPKSMDTQYFGDMTRTVVKGRASPAFSKQWHAVRHAQETGIKMVKAGIDGKKIHDWICKYFEEKGYRTGMVKGRMQGFFHGTGHGLGIDIHEAPRVARVSNILKPGMVVTVEPGLYYLGVGGCRIEDVVYVKKGGCEVLSSCPKILEIP